MKEQKITKILLIIIGLIVIGGGIYWFGFGSEQKTQIKDTGDNEKNTYINPNLNFSIDFNNEYEVISVSDGEINKGVYFKYEEDKYLYVRINEIGKYGNNIDEWYFRQINNYPSEEIKLDDNRALMYMIPGFVEDGEYINEQIIILSEYNGYVYQLEFQSVNKLSSEQKAVTDGFSFINVLQKYKSYENEDFGYEISYPIDKFILDTVDNPVIESETRDVGELKLKEEYWSRYDSLQNPKISWIVNLNEDSKDSECGYSTNLSNAEVKIISGDEWKIKEMISGNDIGNDGNYYKEYYFKGKGRCFLVFTHMNLLNSEFDLSNINSGVLEIQKMLDDVVSSFVIKEFSSIDVNYNDNKNIQEELLIFNDQKPEEQCEKLEEGSNSKINCIREIRMFNYYGDIDLNKNNWSEYNIDSISFKYPEKLNFVKIDGKNESNYDYLWSLKLLDFGFTITKHKTYEYLLYTDPNASTDDYILDFENKYWYPKNYEYYPEDYKYSCDYIENDVFEEKIGSNIKTTKYYNYLSETMLILTSEDELYSIKYYHPSDYK